MAVLLRAAMSAGLRPELALAYLRELSPSISASALRVGDGEPVGDAGPRALLAPAADAPAPAGALVVRDGDAALAAVAGPDTPRALVEWDMRLAIAAVRGRC